MPAIKRLFSALSLIIIFHTMTYGQLHPVKSHNNWGLMNTRGELVVPFEYDAIGEFINQQYAVVQKDGKMGLIDTAGQSVIACKYGFLNHVGEDFYYILDSGGWKVINLQEKVILDDMVGKIDLLGNGYLTFSEIGGKGLAHIDRGVILEPHYLGFEFVDSNYIAAIISHNNKALFSNEGKQILPAGFEEINVSDNHIWGFRSGKWGAYTLDGSTIIAPAWTKYRSLNDNFAELMDEDEVHHLYSFAHRKIIHSDMRYYQVFKDSMCKVYNFYNKVGLIDDNGNVLVEDEYDAITDFGTNTFRVKGDDGIGVMRTDGQALSAMDYDYIGVLDQQVATIRKDDKWGIMNLNGQVVLPMKYDNLNLSQNLARFTNKDGQVQMFFFDGEGQLEENKKYANLKSLKIRQKVRVGNGNFNNANTTRDNPFQISDSLAFKFHPKTRLWGLWYIDSARFKFPPQWSNVTVLKDQGISIVEKADRKIGGEIRTGFLNLEINRVYGLFTNKHGLPISRMEFTDFRLTDITQKKYPVARCIFVGGTHGLIADNGKVVARGYAYIGEFVEGKARATKKGNIRTDVDDKIERPLMPSLAYYNNMMARYAFESGTLDKWIDLFGAQGMLYVKDAKWGFIDSTGALNSNFKYDYVTDYSNDRAMVRKDDRWGMIDDDGNEVLEPVYDDINFLPKSDKNLFFISRNIQLKGAIDDASQIVVPVRYTKIRSFNNDLVAVRNVYRKWGYVNRNAEESIPAVYRQAHDFSEGLAVVYQNNKWGAINTNGDFKISPIYTQMGDFKEGKAWVRLKNGKKGYVTKDGDLLFSGSYSKLTDFQDSVARFYIRKKGWGLLDVAGNYILKPQRRIDKIEPFNEYGLAKVKIGNKYRLINREGKFVGKHTFGTIKAFKEGYAVVRRQAITGFHIGKRNLNYTFIDTLGNIICPKEYRQIKAFSEGRAVFKSDEGTWGYLNYQGEEIIAPEYFRCEDFKDNRAIVWHAYNKTGVIDTNSRLIIPVKYDKIVDFKEHLALVRKNSWTYFFVRENTKRNSPENYEKAYAYHHGLAPVQKQQKWGVVNEKGLTTVIPKYGSIRPYKDGIAQVEVDKLVGVVDIKGNVVIPPEYEYVSYVGDGLFRVESGDKVGYLNMQGNWVWSMQ